MRDVDALNAGDQGRRRVGLRRRAAPAEHGHRRAAPGRRGAHDRRPVRRGQGALGGFYDHQGARSRRRARLGPQARRGRPRSRSRCGRSRTSRATDAARCRPLAAAEIERVFREEYGRAVAVLVRVFGDIDIAEEAVQDAFTAAVQRWPSTGCRRARRAGSSPPPATGRSTACAGRPPARTGTPRPRCCTPATNRPRRDAVRDDRLRLIFTCCHPALAAGAAGRADAAAARRAHHRGDRARVPGPRADHGPAAGAGQGQDPRRADPVPGAERGRPPGPPARRAGRRLPDLQRGLHGELGRPARPRGPLRARPSASAGCWPS